MGDGYIRQVRATGGYLVARSFQKRFREEWFDPGFWDDNAVPVTQGGRGAAWFIRSEAGDLVLRHFCRGGVPGRLVHRDYIFSTEDAVRSFAEFRLLHLLFHKGFPVPEPVAAGYTRRGLLFYQASLIMRRIPGARPLLEFASIEQAAVWQAAGACVRSFHDAGVFHADLNCMNILVADGVVYLIDFDRGRMMPAVGDDRWKASNINRLARSIRKCLGNLDIPQRERLWQQFLDGYAGS